MFFSSLCNSCIRQFSRTLSRRLKSEASFIQVRRHSVDIAHNIYKGNVDLSSIVIIHGLFGSKSNWATIAKRLNKDTGFTTVTVDVRNHGDSPHVDVMTFELMGQDIKSLVTDKLSLSSCILIGHSLGGKVAMVTSLIQPSLVDKLIVVDSSPRKSTSEGDSWVKEYIKAMMSADLQGNHSTQEQKKNIDLHLQKTMPEESIRQFIMKNLRRSNGGFEWQLNLNALLQNYSTLVDFPIHNTEFRKPVLFIKGGRSDYIQTTDYPEIFRLFPSAIVENIGDAGHWVHADKPNEFLQVVKRFIENKD